MATGWRRQNGLELNTGVEAQEDAQITGGEVYLNIPNRSLDVIPASDGSGAIVHMSVPLPAGVGFSGSWAETTHGWKREMDNGWLYRLLNLQSIKVPQALSAYAANGAMFIFDHIPTSDVVNSGDGYWRPKELHLDVTNGLKSDFSVGLYPALTQQQVDDGWEQPAHVAGGLWLSHKDKKNNNGKANYMTGKFLEIPAPLLVAWDSDNNYVGHFFGEYEDLGGGKFVKAYHIQNALAALGPAQDIAYLSISADLGYTTLGAVNSSFIDLWASGPYPATEDGTVDSFNFTLGSASANVKVGMWDDNSGTAGALVADSELDVGFVTYVGSQFYSANYSTKPSIVSGSEYWLGLVFGANVKRLFDTGGAYDGEKNSAATYGAALPDPFNQDSQSAGLTMSYYVSYTPAAATPVTTNTTLTPDPVVKGVDGSVTADITADSTIDSAEYYVGSDPGEGLGTAMTLGAGTTSRAASATVDTSSLPYGSNTIRVRGHTAAEGWGATDSDLFRVTVATPTNVAAVGTATGIDVTWDAVSGATNYTVYWKTSAGVTDSDNPTAGVTSPYSVALADGTERFFRVRADAGVGNSESELSVEVSATAGLPVIGGGGVANTTIVIGNGGISG